MDTRDLKCFCKICEEQSISKAARQLYITPQGLSRMIDSLEQELDTKLFYRNAKGVFPTKSGRFLYRQSEKLLNGLEEIKAGIRQMERPKQLCAGYACGVLNTELFIRLKEYAERQKEFGLIWEEDTNEEIKRKVNRFELDLGFVIGKTTGELYQEKLQTKRLGALVYKGHPLWEETLISLSSLQGEKLITLNERFCCFQMFQKACEKENIKPDIFLKTMDSRLLYKTVYKQGGIGIDVDFEENLEMDGLKLIPFRENIAWDIYGICRKENVDRFQIKELFSCLTDFPL